MSHSPRTASNRPSAMRRRRPARPSARPTLGFKFADGGAPQPPTPTRLCFTLTCSGCSPSGVRGPKALRCVLSEVEEGVSLLAVVRFLRSPFTSSLCSSRATGQPASPMHAIPVGGKVKPSCFFSPLRFSLAVLKRRRRKWIPSGLAASRGHVAGRPSTISTFRPSSRRAPRSAASAAAWTQELRTPVVTDPDGLAKRPT
eukprot:scaffold3131_cov91-Phaeocystis_antarctica.AAC.2